MAYERHTWACGETITEQKMNNIEDGIEEALECCGGSGGDITPIIFETEESYSEGTYLLTIQANSEDIYAAMQTGRKVYARIVTDPSSLTPNTALQEVVMARAYFVCAVPRYQFGVVLYHGEWNEERNYTSLIIGSFDGNEGGYPTCSGQF